MPELPSTLGALKNSKFGERQLTDRTPGERTVKSELRENLICKLQRGDDLFPGVVGFDDTVIPQIVNAVLSRHNFILLGLRGQAKSRILRSLATLLDDEIPYIEGCEIHDDPLRPLCRPCLDRLQEQGDNAPIAYLGREHRFIEKLA